ncbi:hypothetical protein DPEC_G00187650 [Dallia pectoralis]|uniref:Uncharacterized protein n=1 Tax=Dallia pectoralis TaxID=75939 RepID=A0ACC2GBI7_DALPE|nr:hypothetical protein DPEC_G00187650 [Dallia pectoralis]
MDLHSISSNYTVSYSSDTIPNGKELSSLYCLLLLEATNRAQQQHLSAGYKRHDPRGFSCGYCLLIRTARVLQRPQRASSNGCCLLVLATAIYSGPRDRLAAITTT